MQPEHPDHAFLSNDAYQEEASAMPSPLERQEGAPYPLRESLGENHHATTSSIPQQ